jgi:Sodium:sulfate symporter transmembrane region
MVVWTLTLPLRDTAWWRWAIVLIPGALLYFFPLPGLNAPQSQLLGVFAASVIALVAQPVPMGVSILVAMTRH